MLENLVKSQDGVLRFGDFTLDPANRVLCKAGVPIDLGGRYLDALVMLARAPGQLVSKDQLHEEVWRGVPVTDEALSQAIMALRRALGDDASRPRFIETVPRHGYRFVGRVNTDATLPDISGGEGHPTLMLVGGGVLGAAASGLAVGLIYGSLSAGTGPGSALSLMLVLICVSVLAALVSGLGIAGGIGLFNSAGRGEWWRPILGGASGGLLLGGFARLLGIDTLRLLVGSAPDRITGAGEGLVMGLVVGLSFWIASRRHSLLRHIIAPLLGAIGGLGITLAGGTLMAGSLAALVARFPASSLSLSWTADAFLLAAASALEGALFAGFVVSGMLATRRSVERPAL